MKHLQVDLKIAKPCSQEWSQMLGSQSERHCDSCGETVHNLEALTARQIEALLVETNGSLCGRLRTLPDLTVAHRAASPWGGSIAFVTLSLLTSSVKSLSAQAPLAKMADTGAVSSPPNSLLRGAITDHTGALVVGARIVVSDGKEVVASRDTNALGEYLIDLPAGAYTITITAEGFTPYRAQVRIDSGQTMVESVLLNAGTTDNVSVTAQLMKSSDTTMGAVISSVSYGPWYKRLGIRLRHPIAYTRYAFRHK